MVEAEERIRRMAEEGLLDSKQAEMLRASFAGRHAVEPVPHSGAARVRGLYLGMATLACVGAIYLLSSGGPELEVIQDVSKTINQPGEHGEMNRTPATFVAIGLLLIVPLLLWAWMHNSLVAHEEKVFETWAQTESNFQRRADLIPNIVETVTRFLKHEKETLTDVTAARAMSNERLAESINKLIGDQKASSDLLQQGKSVVEDTELMKKLVGAQTALRANVTNLMAVSEQYPELRSSDQFLQLQAQLEGTENRINVARMRFNTAVGNFNGAIRKLPWSLVATVSNFKRKAYFRSDEEARDAPELDPD